MKEARGAWRVVWGAFFSLGVIFGVAYSFAAFFEPFAREFNAQRADVSLVFGLSGLIYFVLGAAGGMLADRFGPRLVCGAGMLFIAGGLLATSLAKSMLTVYLAYGVGIGVGIALVYTPAIACVQPWFTQRRGLAAGIASAGIGAGTVAIPLLAAAAILAVEWRAALRLLALGVLVLGMAAAWQLQRAPAAPGGGAGPGAGSSLREALRHPQFWWMYLMAVTAAPSMFIPFAHVSAAARDMGIADGQAVGLVGLIGIGSLVGRFAIGILADTLGRTVTLVLMQASIAATLLLWQLAGGYAALVVFALWFGISYGGVVALMPAICMDVFGARAVSSIVGVLYTGAALGNLAGPVVAGAVFDHAGSYTAVIWGCILLSVVATAAAGRLVGWRGVRY